MENYFGKKRKVNPDAKKAMRLKYSEGISLKEAWAIVKGKKKVSKGNGKVKSNSKKEKSSLEKMSMKKLEALAKKHKISVLKKDKTKVKKSTLIRRLKSVKKTKFGSYPLEEQTGSTLAYFKNRDANMPMYLRMPGRLPVYDAKYSARSYAAVRPSMLLSGTKNGTSLSAMPKDYKCNYGKKKSKNYFGNLN